MRPGQGIPTADRAGIVRCSNDAIEGAERRRLISGLILDGKTGSKVPGGLRCTPSWDS